MAEYLMGEYSQELFDEMWNIMERDYEQDYDSDEVADKIKDPGFLRPFSERLLAFYNDVIGTNFTAEEATKDLQRRAKENNKPSRNTIDNWFSGAEPKYGDNDRKNLFAVAFALELDVEQTERLFHKVFLDKAFNKRNAREFVYLYCIKNRKPLTIAETILDKLDNVNEANFIKEQTEQTRFLADAVQQDMDEDELLRFIFEHPHNFSLRNTAAKQHRRKLLERLTIGNENMSGLAQKEFELRRLELSDKKEQKGYAGKDPNSVDFLLYMIMGEDFSRKGNKDILSIRDKLARKEIYNQFPDKQTLSSKDPSSYILRKDIILLYFYNYWVSDYLDGNNTGDFDGFVDGLNDVLHECGFSPLYIGNPYDWLFLYCSACAVEDYTPLDKLRSILA